MRRHELLSIAAGLALALSVGGATVHADEGNNQNGGGNNGQQGGNYGDPKFNTTPELDSIALFGSGAAGLAGYALMRIRAGRRQDKTAD